MTWTRLTLIVMVAYAAGCDGGESQASFENRQQAINDAKSELDAIHQKIANHVKSHAPFELVSQPNTESTAPGELDVHRQWVIAPDGDSTNGKNNEQLVQDLKKLSVTKQAGTGKTPFSLRVTVTEDGERVVVEATVKWIE